MAVIIDKEVKQLDETVSLKFNANIGDEFSYEFATAPMLVINVFPNLK